MSGRYTQGAKHTDIVPCHLQPSFNRISKNLSIVKWVGEKTFSAVRTSLVFPLGRSERDHQLAERSVDVLRRYSLALELIS